MNRLLYSIEFRLILGFAAVLALVLGSVSVYARTAAANEVERFESELSSVREERLERFVSGFVAARGDMRELQPVVDQAGSLYGLSIVIEDHEGTVVTETQGLRDYSFFTDTPEVPTRDWLRVRRRFGGDVRFLPIGVSGEQVGSIAFTSAGRDSFVRPEPQATAVVDNINDFLLWAGIAGLIGGIGLTVVVSRRTLTPLRALRTGAEQLGAGDLTYRVPVSGQSELGRLGDTFNAMAEGLQSAEDQRRSLMADIAHELRTPLSNIQGYVEAMRDGLVKPDASTIETLHQQVTQLAHLMEDLRLLALADAGALRLDPRPESMAEVLRGSVEAVRPRADAKGVALETEIGDAPPALIDRARIGQVVGNLLDNAIVHTPEGGRVLVTLEADESIVRVSVADTGEGIPPEEIERIFERFHRVDPSRTRATGGAGLGLTIARQLVEAHGGSISAESQPGGGARFTFEVPIAPQEQIREQVQEEE